MHNSRRVGSPCSIVPASPGAVPFAEKARCEDGDHGGIDEYDTSSEMEDSMALYFCRLSHHLVVLPVDRARLDQR